MAVSPDGAEVLVTGPGYRAAYNAATGAQLWAKFYAYPGTAVAMAVSPTGDRVFVTGWSYGPDTAYDYATVAYNAGTGAQLWIKRYDYYGGDEFVASVAVSPGGDKVFVTGDHATIAYNAATGAVLWLKPYKSGASMVVSPTGGTVFVTGASDAPTGETGYATAAYNPVTGAQLWVTYYTSPFTGGSRPSVVTVSPRGDTLFVTGSSAGATPGDYGDYATVAYNATTGAQLWAKRYNGPGNGPDTAMAVAVSPTGDRVFVTGSSPGAGSGEDYATIAYAG